MSVLSLLTDEYEYRARLRPALLVSLPVVSAVMAWLPDVSGIQVFVGVTAYCGFTGLLAQLARDQGKLKEPCLFQQWGGKPTTQLLRHRDTYLDGATKARYHASLNAIVPDVVLPTVGEETADPAKADAIYNSCVAFLREKTRDRKVFPLVFAENVHYGFRRNLWGMKAAGIALSVAALVGATGAAVLHEHNNRPPALAVAASVVSVLMLVWWALRIKIDWVRVPAFAYAERLLATCDSLGAERNQVKTRIVIP